LPDQWEYHTGLVAYVFKNSMLSKSNQAGEAGGRANDLINVFGMKPGAKMGLLLEENQRSAGGRGNDG